MLLDAIEWLGHSGFRVDAGGATVYIDPYRIAGGDKADVILVTHGHYDHFSPLVIEELSHSGTWLVAPPAVAERVSGQVVSVVPGDVVELDTVPGLEVAAVAAYNTSKRDPSGEVFHPREAGLVGYHLNVRGERLYHSGDTDVIPEMDSVVGVDVALLPVSGTYVMTPAEAAEAARRIDPGVAVPMHWGEHIGTHEDAEAFARMAPVRVEIMQPAKARQ
jgi:L-ascorbate metabolism protein UlaG (beta-lactamase superfamily)